MIKNQKVLILGMARSGIAVSKLLSHYDNDITISDRKEQTEETLQELQNLGIKIVITSTQEDLVNASWDCIIKNPGIPQDAPALVKARELSIPILNELEASFAFLPKDVTIIGITGSNGKTTSTTIAYELLKRSEKKVYVGGNIGIPLASLIPEIESDSLLVLEISDHQLCDMSHFKTDISVLTNLSEVHLDFHGSYEKYKNTKKRIFNHHTEKDIAILNQDNQDVLELTKDIPSHVIYFSSKCEADIYLKDNQIYYHDEAILSCDAIKLKGVHNYENCMVGIALAKLFGVSNTAILDFLKDFGGVEHRMEFVRTFNERAFYNDSKATNNQSTIIALDSFKEPTLLLMGGLDRNIPFDEIASHLKNVKAIFCFGETKEKIKEFALKNQKPVFVFDTMKEATLKAYEESSSGDVILLSPACASWDQYPDFEKRGLEFKEIVNHLE